MRICQSVHFRIFLLFLSPNGSTTLSVLIMNRSPCHEDMDRPPGPCKMTQAKSLSSRLSTQGSPSRSGTNTGQGGLSSSKHASTNGAATKDDAVPASPSDSGDQAARMQTRSGSETPNQQQIYPALPTPQFVPVRTVTKMILWTRCH